MIYVIKKEDGFEVWLDTEVAECDGICLDSGPTESDALFGAAETLFEARTELLDKVRKAHKL